MEISIISDIFTVFLLALLRLGRILPGFFATMLPHMAGVKQSSTKNVIIKTILSPSYGKDHTSLEDTLTFPGVRFDIDVLLPSKGL